MVANIEQFNAPTEMDHTQIRRVLDIYVRPQSEDLGRIAKEIQKIVDESNPPHGINVALTGSVASMNSSFQSFAIGLILSVLLLYLILVAQFRSFVDPFIILLGPPSRHRGCADRASAVGYDSKRHVSDGRRHAGRYCGLK